MGVAKQHFMFAPNKHKTCTTFIMNPAVKVWIEGREYRVACHHCDQRIRIVDVVRTRTVRCCFCKRCFANPIGGEKLQFIVEEKEYDDTWEWV